MLDYTYAPTLEQVCRKRNGAFVRAAATTSRFSVACHGTAVGVAESTWCRRYRSNCRVLLRLIAAPDLSDFCVQWRISTDDSNGIAPSQKEGALRRSDVVQAFRRFATDLYAGVLVRSRARALRSADKQPDLVARGPTNLDQVGETQCCFART